MESNVAYIHSPLLQNLADIGTHPSNRSTQVHSLIHALGYLSTGDSRNDADNDDHKNMGKRARVVPPCIATREDLERYHTEEYVDALLSQNPCSVVETGSPPRSGSSSGSCSGSSSDLDSELGSSRSSRSTTGRRPKKRSRRESFGLHSDCPRFPALPAYARAIAGSTLTAARLLCSSSPKIPAGGGLAGGGEAEVVGTRGGMVGGCESRSGPVPCDRTTTKQQQEEGEEETTIAINWEGGRHHALRNRASGFCYVQDIVLGITHLRSFGCVRVPSPTISGEFEYVLPSTMIAPKRRPRIMYIDLDVHYGDGPSQAFRHPYPYSHPLTERQKRQPRPSVLTVSVHHHSPGFFPADPGASLNPEDTKGVFNLSIPLRPGSSNGTYRRVFERSIGPLENAFGPDYIVLLLGTDALAGDPLVRGVSNWGLGGEGGMIWICERVKGWGKRCLVLGGGGYERSNAARAWAGVTGVFLDRPFDPESVVPEHDHWLSYAPDFSMDVRPCEMRDENDEAYLSEIERVSRVWVDRVREIMGTGGTG